jgi:adenylosuccinate lyase
MGEEIESVFESFSPVDYRFKVKDLKNYFSENSFVSHKAMVEGALAKVKAKRGLISKDSADRISAAAMDVKAHEVYAEEENTHHDIIAQNNVTKRRLNKVDHPAVHVPLTSYDKVDTANVLRYKGAVNNVIIPDMKSLVNTWIDVTRKEKDTPQIGRTHLQHAEPITFGFANALYLDRFGGRMMKIKEAAEDLRGKISGAVGAYNAQSLFVDDPEEFEVEVLGELGLKPGRISSQIMQQEPVTDLAHYMISGFCVLANYSEDVRHLQMPELGEIGQPRGPDISRSSTMPHKANPSGAENTISLWKVAMPFMNTMYLDEISDFQRDLTNSASQRFLPSVMDVFDYSVRRTNRIAKNLKSHPENMKKNLNMSADKVIAEPLHIILSSYGHPNSHEYVGKLADQSYITGKPLTEIVLNDVSLEPYLKKFTPKQIEVIHDPKKYLGIASKKAEKVADYWDNVLKKI